MVIGGTISSAFLILATIKFSDIWHGAKVGAFRFYESPKQNYGFSDISRASSDATFACS